MGLRDIFKKDKNEERCLQHLPRHVTLTAQCPGAGAPEGASGNAILNFKNIIKASFRLNIPLITLTVRADLRDVQALQVLTRLFTELSRWEPLHKECVKVSVLGKWYDLPSQVIAPIKAVLDATYVYDRFFLNLCINYDGQDEIVDACRLIARKVKAGKLDPEGIDKSLIKDNVYTSYFFPPDLIVCTGMTPTLGGVLLWDSTLAQIYFANTPWHAFDRDAYFAILRWFSEQKGKDAQAKL